MGTVERAQRQARSSAPPFVFTSRRRARLYRWSVAASWTLPVAFLFAAATRLAPVLVWATWIAAAATRDKLYRDAAPPGTPRRSWGAPWWWPNGTDSGRRSAWRTAGERLRGPGDA